MRYNRQRRDAYAKLLQARASGDSGALARLLARAIRISPQLTPAVLQGVREAGHQYVVSPYEADAQCAFLNRRDVGYVSAVITEDSDLVAFGATTVGRGAAAGVSLVWCLPPTHAHPPLGCQVLHHVDTKTWKAHEFDVAAALQRGRLRGLSRDLVGYHREHTQQSCSAHCTPCGSQSRLLTVTLLLLTQVLCVCILSGCDYLPKQVAPGRPCDAVRGFGQGRALNLVQRGFINYPADVLGHITGNRGLHHGENFRERFQDAILGFRHHVVWDHRVQVRGPTLWCCSRPWRGVCPYPVPMHRNGTLCNPSFVWTHAGSSGRVR